LRPVVTPSPGFRFEFDQLKSVRHPSLDRSCAHFRAVYGSLTIQQLHEESFYSCSPVFVDAFEIEQVPVHLEDPFSRPLARIDFLEAPSMHEQLHVTCEELCGPDNTRLPLEVISGFPRFSHQALFNHFHRPIETKAIGRPKCLPPEASEIIWKIIANHFERWAPAKYNFI
jgi:hypothetical protein